MNVTTYGGKPTGKGIGMFALKPLNYDGRFDAVRLLSNQCEKAAPIEIKVIEKKPRKQKVGKGYREVKNRKGEVVRYEARITINAKAKSLGYFKTSKAANTAYLNRWIKEFGPIPEQ